MKILLLAHAYPPYPASGALRPAKVVAALRRRGHAVHVITSRLPGEDGAPRVDEHDHTVVPVRYVPNPLFLYGVAKRGFAALRRRGGNNTTEGTQAQQHENPESGPALKRYLLSFLQLPDDQQGFAATAVLRALPHIRGGVDLLYTTGPIISTHVAGLLLKRLTGVRWAAEFRDLWTQDPAWDTMRSRQSRASVAIERWLELRFLLRADHVVAVSNGIRQHLMQRLDPTLHDRFIVARNGIAHLAEGSCDARAPGPLRVAYLGTLGMMRDPRPFLEALAAVRRSGAAGSDDVVVDLVGDCEYYQTLPIRPFVETLGLADSVRFHGWLPHTAAQKVMDDADLLLLLAQEQPDAVPNKLYEYLGTRKPIVAYADDAGESAFMLRRAGGHHVISEFDAASVAEDTLRQLLREHAAGIGPRGDESILREWTTDLQMEHLLDALAL